MSESAKAKRAASRVRKPATPQQKHRPTPNKTDPFAMVFWQQRNKNQRPTPQEEEIILACYALTENKSQVSRMTGWSTDTISTVVERAEDSGYLADLRIQRREDFIEVAWNGIMLAAQTILDGLKKGYIKGGAVGPDGQEVPLVSRVSPGEAARVLQSLHHAAQLHEGKPTDIISRLAEEMSTEELRAEIERRYKEMFEAPRKGPLQ